MYRVNRAFVVQGLEWIDRSAQLVMCCLVLGLIAVGIAYSLYLGNLFRFADERDYWDLGSSIASELKYSHAGFQAYRPSGYPAFLSLIIALDGSVWVARFLNFVLLSGSAICLYDLGRRLARSAAGAVAACWIAGYVLGHWIFVSTNSGVNLALGNSPGTKPGSGVNVDLSHIHFARGVGEEERNRTFTNAALRWMEEHPLSAVRLYIEKLAHYFAITEQLTTRSQNSSLYAYILI